ncbi:MAG TPA: hypothetical protein VKD26_08205 [Streptosporangiaceae bacterium]|nr:hypothetical protein [Streptosporangiaceae bacterium]
MTEEPKSAVPAPEGERDEKDWEERRKVALEAWRMGKKLAAEQNRKSGIGRRIYRRRTAAR